jgi:hypothetical protein
MTENITLHIKASYVEYERRLEESFCRVFMRERV